MLRVCVFVLLFVGCATDEDLLDGETDPQDATAGLGGKSDLPDCDDCGARDAPNILFPGNPACVRGPCERPYLAADDLYVPPTNGAPWGETYALGTDAPATIAGYSSGRIALLRRLALVGDGARAVLLDPSYEDNARDFAGRGPEYGDAIVRDWLLADPARTFVLIYSTSSVGWRRYAALARDVDVGDRVTVRSTSAPHLRVPRIRGLHDDLVD